MALKRIVCSAKTETSGDLQMRSDPFKKCNLFFIHVVLGRIKKWLLDPQHKCVYHRHTAGCVWGKLQTLHPRNETCLVFIEKNQVTVWQRIYSKYAGRGTL